MIEATTQAHIAQAMHRAHAERSKAFSVLWGWLWNLSVRRSRAPSSRWA
ncbi:hypothetical protein [Tritonibacter litoralis]|nr:hypothetical protein [Tritonibacter litoralis]